jgi:hypothetical protein
MPTCVSVVLPTPIASAHSHNRRVRGSRLPISGSIAVNATPPTSARNVAIMIGAFSLLKLRPPQRAP